ncbi:MAG: PAS domain-containing protein [Nodularia sp. CChRGM 3473]
MPEAETFQNHRQVSEPVNYSSVASQAEGMLLQLADGSIQACNVAAESILGLTTKQLIGLNLFDLPWQADETHPAMLALKSGRPCLQVISGFYQPNGNLIWLLLNSQPLFQSTEVAPYAVVTTFTEITADKRQHVEDNGKSSQDVKYDDAADWETLWDKHLIQQIAEIIPGLLYIYDLVEQRNFYVNHEICELWGYSPAEIQAMGTELFKKLMHPEDLARLPAHFEQFNSAGSGEIFIFEYRIQHLNGEWRWFCSYETLFRRTADGLPQQILGIAFDITERRRTEVSLWQSNERFTLAAEAANCLIYDWDFHNNTIHRTQGLNQIFGYTQQEAKPTWQWWRELIHPDDQQMVDEQFTASMAKGNHYMVEYRVRHQNGGYLWVNDRGFAVRDTDNQIIRIVGASTDISERKQAEAELKQANQIKDEFLAILSHELRSPLNPILGWSTLLKSRKFDQATTNRALDIIERNAKLQIKLIDDLLDVSRIIRGKLSLNFTVVNLGYVIDAALEMVRLAAEEKSIQIHQQIDRNVGQVWGDFHRIQQVVGNLLSNSIKFTPSGQQIDIILSAIKADNHHSPNYAQITVRDTGQGISPEFLPRVFEYFLQADSSITRKFGGLGLGLAIVRHLVGLHGGTVVADSLGEGQGATFTVRLPLMPEKVKVQKQKSQEDKQKLDSSLLSGLRILIVDDEADTLEFISFLLQQYGAIATMAASATEAMAVIAQSPPDLLISDLGMPEVDGYSLIRRIRAMPPERGGKIPAIALTAYARESDRQRVLAAGFQKHVAKPVASTELLILIADMMRQRHN